MYSNVTFSVTWRPDFRHRICNFGSVSDTRSDKSHWDGNQFKLTPSSVSAASLNTVFVLRYSVKIRMLCISASLEVRDVVCEEIILSVNREVNGVYLDFFFFSVHPALGEYIAEATCVPLKSFQVLHLSVIYPSVLHSPTYGQRRKITHTRKVTVPPYLSVIPPLRAPFCYI